MTESTFPIPASLQDLEREPFNLQPYPTDFDDSDESARADSFQKLVDLLEDGNYTLTAEGSTLFGEGMENDPWNSYDRMQAMYTLVRKSTSLSPSTRSSLIESLCQAVKVLASILDDKDNSNNDDSDHHTPEEDTGDDADNDQAQESSRKSSAAKIIHHRVMSQAFRDAYACHMYMLFSVMFFLESEAKINSGMKTGRSEKTAESEEVIAIRAQCADAMLAAAQSLSKNRTKMWKRGVPDEDVVVLPCRIAYQMLETASGVVARKAASADAALAMIAATVDSSNSLLSTIVAALMDLLHSYDHMAPLCAELCCMVQEQPVNRFAIELIREIGRLDTSGQGDNQASGIKNVAPFIGELAQRRPMLVLSNISHLLPQLNAEPYCLRSAIVTSLGHIVEYIVKSQQPTEGQSNNQDALEFTIVQKDGEASRLNIDKSMAALLDILEARSHDISSYTRSTVLKTWVTLSENGSLPVDRVIPVTALAIDRLQDKAVMVRKQAMHLLTTVLENNPFSGDLDPEPYTQKLEELYNFVKANLPGDIKDAYESALEEAKENDDDNEETLMELEHATLSAAIAEADAMDGSDELTEEEKRFCSMVEALKYAQSALDFIDQFECASVALHGMLLSANTSDVTEALRFFVKARHFKLPCAVTGIKQALSLMWSSEQSIKEEVLKAFSDVFIAVPGTNGKQRLPDDQVAYNLLLLAENATVSEMASIEEAIGQLVKEGRISPGVFSVLWSATAQGPGKSRAVALHVLSMAASADKSIVDSKSRLKLLADVALGDHTEEHRDWKTARAAALVLQRIERAKVDHSDAKYLVLEFIIERLCSIARGDWCQDSRERDTLEWFSAAEEAISALFIICPEPEAACGEIIRGMHEQTLGSIGVETCHPLRLARFFHALGHIALKLLVYTEALSSSVRRANAKKTLKKQEDADRAKAGRLSSQEDEDIEAELGMAQEIEAENERKVAEIAEKEIVGRGLISIFGPILVRVVGNEGGRFSSQVLMQTSTLALCKFMCVSSSFCEKHLPVLFTALANAPARDTVLRANTVVALGDLAFRFPNEVEPYTPRLYACLRDSSTKVRRHTLMVLTHLILNDMVKVKGQVCEIALCLRDDDQRIRDMSRLLFHELSKRSNNPVYNMLPDIISQLSQVSISKEDFRSIMSFLLGYIKKERQNEMLIEKLCQRFPKCSTVSQKADIAYCLAQLKVNEKSIKCLSDNFKLYKDALFDEEVKKSFASIVSKTKKFAKPELKQLVEDWENKLSEQADIAGENHRAGEKAAKARVKASKRAGKARRPRPEPIQEWSEGEDDEDEVEAEVESSQSEEENLMDKENATNVPSEPTPVKGSDRSTSSRSRNRRARSTRGEVQQ